MKIRHFLPTIISLGFAHAEIQSVKVPSAAMKREIPATVIRLGIFAADGKLLHDTAFDIDLHPAASKGTKLEEPGGQARKLIGR